MIKIPTISTYYGGKGSMGTAQRIINRIRPHDTLIIPYLGNCALTRKMRWPAQVIANDLDPFIIDQWRAANLGPQLDLYNLPALDFLSTVLKLPSLGRIVIYCDPPYPLDSRKSQREVYKFEMTDRDHQEFLAAVRLLPVDCLISTYPNQLYAEELSHWQRTEFQSQTRKGPATEWLFFNYPSPVVLHDERFGGENYRQREYVKRKAARWVKRFQEMPPHEQQLILSQVLSTAPDELVQQLVQAKSEQS